MRAVKIQSITRSSKIWRLIFMLNEAWLDLCWRKTHLLNSKIFRPFHWGLQIWGWTGWADPSPYWIRRCTFNLPSVKKRNPLLHQLIAHLPNLYKSNICLPVKTLKFSPKTEVRIPWVGIARTVFEHFISSSAIDWRVPFHGLYSNGTHDLLSWRKT